MSKFRLFNKPSAETIVTTLNVATQAYLFKKINEYNPNQTALASMDPSTTIHRKKPEAYARQENMADKAEYSASIAPMRLR